MLTKNDLKKLALSFARSFAIVFLFGIIPVWENIAAGDWDAAKTVLLALVTGAGTAGIRAIQAVYENRKGERIAP